MRKLIVSVAGLLALITLVLAVAPVQAGPTHKCTINGKVSFQQAPCPVTQPAGAAREPSLAELNAREKERRAATSAAKRPPVSATGGTAGASSPPEPFSPVEQRPAGFRCDGRTHCSQMRSCDEAKYFLANCPGAKMDGDQNGLPCEKQWCGR